ncbi:MAG TPA: YkvA family protein [Gammaproteobacteria bacterium]|nr:YkvA family protein [Gammaproteobacteria bacterium]
MPIKIVLELGDEDLTYYRRVMEDVWKKNSKRNEKELVEGARRLLKQATKVKGSPEYIQARMVDLGVLIDLLDDPEWPLSGDNRKRIVSAVGYFAVAKDMIPDKIPGIGFLDDAIMAELTLEALKHDLEGYRDFCKYRDNEAKLRGKKVNREDWLEAKRRQIFMRIERRQRESRRHGSSFLPMSIFRY